MGELGNVGQGYKLAIKKSIKFWGSNTQHNDYRQSTAKYISKLLRDHKKSICEMTEILTKAIVVIILQYINLSSQ